MSEWLDRKQKRARCWSQCRRRCVHKYQQKGSACGISNRRGTCSGSTALAACLMKLMQMHARHSGTTSPHTIVPLTLQTAAASVSAAQGFPQYIPIISLLRHQKRLNAVVAVHKQSSTSSISGQAKRDQRLGPLSTSPLQSLQTRHKPIPPRLKTDLLAIDTPDHCISSHDIDIATPPPTFVPHCHCARPLSREAQCPRS